MIYIFTIDESGRVIERRVQKRQAKHGRAKLLTPDMPIGDQIFIRPDWPPIGSPDFAEKLRAWHAEHNKPIDASEAE